MSFINDWIDNAENVVRHAKTSLAQTVTHPMFAHSMYELAVLGETLTCLKTATIIKLPDTQLQEFLEIELNQAQDFGQLRSPFKSIYMDVQPALTFNNYFDNIDGRMKTVKVRGALITEMPADYLKDFGTFERTFRLAMFVPLPGADENTFLCSFAVKDGKLVRPVNFATGVNGRMEPMEGRLDDLHQHFVVMAVHIMNYLTSPSIILERKEVAEALQRARIKRGRLPLPGWYEIKYAKTRNAPRPGTGQGAAHSFRYDVRGHFKHIKIGRLAGRVVWCPAHQRGLAHSTYRPKSYRIEKGEN